MENTKYNIKFDKLCEKCHMGKLLCEPKQITGGLLHRMFEVKTEAGDYAIKALNPQVMMRPMARSNILNGEKIAAYAARYIPALPAKQFGETVIHKIDGQHYIIYDWIEGGSIYGENITNIHCEKIGGILGKIHSIDFSSLNIPKPEPVDAEPVDWDFYLQKGKLANSPWLQELSASLNDLSSFNRRYLISMKYLEKPLVIGHGDIDPKNVMWHNNNPVIIDWESAGYLHPAHELIVYAMYWSDVNNKNDKDKFVSFIKGYLKAAKLQAVDFGIVMDAGLSPNWLEYSLKRSLGIESADSAEQQMGTDNVFGTINYLKRYDSSINEILGWLSII